jgi:hypothetical protein
MAVPTFISGIFAFLLSSFIKHVIPWSMALGPEARFNVHGHHITQFEQLVFTKVGDIGHLIVGQILKGVNSTAGIVCVVGIVLYALSFFVGDDNDHESHTQRQKTDQPQPPQPPQQLQQSQQSQPTQQF